MREDDLLISLEGEDTPAGPKRAVPRRGYRILYPLLGILCFVALAPLASLAWKLLATNREALVTSQQEFQLLLASSIAGQLDSHVDGLAGRIETLAGSFGVLAEAQGMAAVEKDINNRPILGNLLDDDLISLRFVTREGRTYQARAAGLEIPSGVEELIGDAVASARRAGEGEGSISSPCLLGHSSQAAVVISAPIVVSGRVEAVLVGLVDLSRVWQRIVERNGTGHRVYAIDRQGRVFADTGGSPWSDADLRDTEIVQRFLKGAGRSKETMLFSVQQAGSPVRSYLGSYESTSHGWGIFVQVEERFAYALIREMVRDTITWSMAALAVAILLGIVFAGKLSQPVRHLTDAARTFAGGNFSARARVRGHDEIGELAENFNHMAEDIESYIKRLREAAREMNEMFLGTVRALAEAIDAKDPYTRGHSVRVNCYSVVIARYMGLDAATTRDIHVASLLHDVGKIGIDDSILKKPAQLTVEEYEIMKQHPDKGAKIMSRVERLKSIIPGMRHHHERYTGGGYPLGLKGEDIPMAARVIAVADSFDAMTSNRPYSHAWTFDRATARLNELKGTGFDPVVVEAWNRAYAAGEFAEEEKRLAELFHPEPTPASAAAESESAQHVPEETPAPTTA